MPSEILHRDGFPLRALSYARRAGEWASFWAAVSLPFATGSLLIAGLHSADEVAAFVCLVAANLVALVGGRGYRRDR